MSALNLRFLVSLGQERCYERMENLDHRRQQTNRSDHEPVRSSDLSDLRRYSSFREHSGAWGREYSTAYLDEAERVLLVVLQREFR